MPKYFDETMQDHEDVNEGTSLYLVSVEGKYGIKGIAAEDLDKLPSDPRTHATHYWLIDDVMAFLAKVNEQAMSSLIFPEDKLTLAPLTLQTVQALGLHPTENDPVPFNNAVGTAFVDDASYDLITNEILIAKIKDYFLEHITPQNHSDIWNAWEELQDDGDVDTIGSAAFAQLNVPLAVQNQIVDELTDGGYFSHNARNRACIQNQFVLSPRYPTHVERFANQINLDELLSLASIQHVTATNTVVESPPAQPVVIPLPHVVQQPNSASSFPPGPVNRSSSSQYRGRLFSSRSPSSLTQNMLEEELHDFVRNHFRQRITRANYHSIHTAWDNYLQGSIPELTVRSKLEGLNVSSKLQRNFLRSLGHNYPGFTLQQRVFIQNKLVRSDEFPIHAYRFGAEVDLSAVLEERGHELFSRGNGLG